jgi:Fic family protein
LWTRQKPERLAALRELAMIQSAGSSNRIEGVTVEPARLRPVALKLSRPRDRSEEEVLGYRQALDWVFGRKRPVTVEPEVILRLHELAQGTAAGDAGQWKRRDNDIVEMLPSGERRVRFRPVSAKFAPKAVAALCRDFREAQEAGRLPSLLLLSAFVFDFLCVHPFRDGNGRVSRLLTTLLLQNEGFAVGRYVSLERLVEQSKAEYYESLERSSAGWHEGRHNLVPWWNHFLGVLRRAYQEFAKQVESPGAAGGKSELVRRTVAAQTGPFALAELLAECPGASPQLVKKVLAEMKKSGRVRTTGRGRGAKWEKSAE